MASLSATASLAVITVVGLVFMGQEMAVLRPAALMLQTLSRVGRSSETFDLVMENAERALEASAAQMPSDVATSSQLAHVHRLKDLSHLMADLELEDLQAELGKLSSVNAAQHVALEAEAHARAKPLVTAALSAVETAAAAVVTTTPAWRADTTPLPAELELKGPIVSLFTTVIDRKDELKAFIQSNTMRSYNFLGPGLAATVFTESAKWANIAREAGISALTQFPKNPHGTPLLKGMYHAVEKTFTSPETTAFFYGYSNADILFSQTLLDTLMVIHRDIVLGRLKPRVLIVGQRINKPVDPSKDGVHRKEDLAPLVLRLAKSGKLFQTNAQDFFFITKGTFEWSKVPDFVIGRHAYDNWLVDHSVHHADIDVIDVTRTVHAVHQTGKDGDFAWMHKKRPPDFYWNEHRGNKQFDHGLTSESNWLTRFDASNQVRLVWGEGRCAAVLVCVCVCDSFHCVSAPSHRSPLTIYPLARSLPPPRYSPPPSQIYLAPRLGGSDFDATEIEAMEVHRHGTSMLHYTTHSDLLHRHLNKQFKRYTLVEHGQNNRCPRGAKSSATQVCAGPDRKDSQPRTYSMWKTYVDAGVAAGGEVDTVLIDGRARIACAAAALEVLSSDDAVVFFHDWKRKYYHVVLELFTLVKQIKSTKAHGGGLAVLKPKPGIRATFSKKAWLRKHSIA